MQGAHFRVDSQSAAADGCTTVIPTSKKFPVFGKIIRRYVLRCGRKRRQVITFSSSNYHGQTATVQKLCFGGTTIVNGSIIASWKPIKNSDWLFGNYNTFFHFNNGVAKDFGQVGCHRSARKYVTVKRSLSSSLISTKSPRSGEFNLFPNFNKVWSTPIARRKHRTI